MESGGIRIGTCSWTEKSLIESGTFYPPGVASSEKRLRFYASHFDTVEVDSSYYAIPTEQMARAWVERTPDKFLFHLKAYGALTGHGIDPNMLPKELRELLPESGLSQDNFHVSEPAALKAMAKAMVSALEPLQEAHKLGFIIFQFPPWFSCKNANRDYLLYCKELMAGLPIAVEFRHGSWLTRQHADETFAFLREHRITYITCDEPQYDALASAPFLPEVTTSMAYLRLHGRNAETWREHSKLRYDYLYGEKELHSISLEARQLSARARMTFIMFNNCHGGHAVRNALQMQEILNLAPKPPGSNSANGPATSS
jgi:uncharacterized protein YecE (DUF72 family)